jgi:hypothetical protein
MPGDRQWSPSQSVRKELIMTAAATTFQDPVGLPATLDGFVRLVRLHEGEPVTEDQMVEAGVEPTIAHMFFANFAGPGRTMPVSDLAPTWPAGTPTNGRPRSGRPTSGCSSGSWYASRTTRPGASSAPASSRATDPIGRRQK